MKNILLLTLISVCFFSCSTSALLTANFESETIGGLPAQNIPGAPSGDEITYSTQLEPRIKVVASTSPGEKAVEFSQNTAPGLTSSNQFLGFRGISTNLTQPLYFLYTARQSGTFNALIVDLSDGSGALLARMYIRNTGDVSLVNNLSTNSVSEVGTISEGTSHVVVFAVDVAAGTYNLTIIKSGGNLSATNKPLLNTALTYANPARPTLSIRYSDGDSPANQYVIEALTISKKDPM